MSRSVKVGRMMDALASTTENTLAIALIVGILLNFANVVGRYIGGFSIDGSDEIEIYILIWIAFLGGALVTWRGQHLRMDVLLETCPEKFRRIVVVLEAVLTGVVACFVAYQSWQYVSRIMALGAVSDIAHVPTWIPHSAVLVSFVLMTIVVGLRAWLTFARDKEKDA
ncbi:MAG: TRAP transporter small permease [Beijerinckiaceae bacterium]|nr:TRAP transporter small permease [Beijerinckiaceae bacterium]